MAASLLFHRSGQIAPRGRTVGTLTVGCRARDCAHVRWCIYGTTATSHTRRHDSSSLCADEPCCMAPSVVCKRSPIGGRSACPVLPLPLQRRRATPHGAHCRLTRLLATTAHTYPQSAREERSGFTLGSLLFNCKDSPYQEAGCLSHEHGARDAGYLLRVQTKKKAG